MFAPPPVQLSRAEVDARLAARRKSAASNGSLTRQTSASSDPKQGSLHESQSPTSPRRKGTINKVEKIKVSAPISSPPSSAIESHRPRYFGTPAQTIDQPSILPSGFGEHPRRAPAPPTKSTRPPDEWFTRSKKATAPPPRSPLPDIPAQTSLSPPPPPIPAKSAKRLKLKTGDEDVLDLLQEDPFSRARTLSASISKLQIKDGAEKAIKERPSQPVRAFTAPAATTDQPVDLSPINPQSQESKVKASSVSITDTSRKAISESQRHARLSAVKGAKVDKKSIKRSSRGISIDAGLLDELYSFRKPEDPPRRATESDIKSERSNTPQELQLPWRRRRKGETMSMLVQSGFFPESYSVDERDASQNLGVQVPLPLAFLNRQLPPTPTSIVPTPTELYQTPPRPNRPVVRKRKAGAKNRSPLAQISTTHAKANANPLPDATQDMSPGRLSTIPERGTFSENSHDSSGVETPVATQIHLRGGSVVTVSPPELTAWKRSIYIQGPIQGRVKLPKPAILPRKNSVASLEPFQEAIDQVYQEALNIPRRRSDDAVVDDVCDFFDDFGFDEISFEGDVLAVEEVRLDDVKEIDPDTSLDLERFSTPPAEPEASPVEKVVAKEFVETMSKSPPVPKPPIPPVENAETLRARGIARLSQGAAAYSASTGHHGRKDSLTLAKSEPSVLPLLPLPEESMLEAVLEPSRAENDVEIEGRAPMDRNIDGDGDVEELDGSSAWLAPGAFPSSSPSILQRSNSKTPLGRVRKLVASASGML